MQQPPADSSAAGFIIFRSIVFPADDPPDRRRSDEHSRRHSAGEGDIKWAEQVQRVVIPLFWHAQNVFASWALKQYIGEKENGL